MTDEDENGSGLRVRPYALTGGRTRVASDLPLESIVRTTERGNQRAVAMMAEAREILVMCGNPLSVAELAVHLRVPLGVAKVLVSDLLVDGCLATHQAVARSGDRPDLKLLERVLNGIQAL